MNLINRLKSDSDYTFDNSTWNSFILCENMIVLKLITSTSFFYDHNHWHDWILFYFSYDCVVHWECLQANEKDFVIKTLNCSKSYCEPNCKLVCIIVFMICGANIRLYLCFYDLYIHMIFIILTLSLVKDTWKNGGVTWGPKLYQWEVFMESSP
jgi:hypothetical protein